MIVSARAVNVPSALSSTPRFCSATKNPGAIAFTRSTFAVLPRHLDGEPASEAVDAGLRDGVAEHAAHRAGAAIDEMLRMTPGPLPAHRLAESHRWRDGAVQVEAKDFVERVGGDVEDGRLSLRARATLPPAALTRMSMRPQAASSSSRAALELLLVEHVGDERRASPPAPESSTFARPRPPAAEDRDASAGRGESGCEASAEHTVAAGDDGDLPSRENGLRAGS